MNSAMMPAGPCVEPWLIRTLVDAGAGWSGALVPALAGLAARADTPATAIDRAATEAKRRTRWDTIPPPLMGGTCAGRRFNSFHPDPRRVRVRFLATLPVI